MKTNWLALVLVIFVLLVISGISCFVYLFINAHDYPVSLGHGYRYFGAKDGDGMVVIDRPYVTEAERERVHELWDENLRKDVYVDPDDVGMPRIEYVDGYHVYPSVITGHVAKPQRSMRGINLGYYKPGYFIIDTRINRVYRGLSKQNWRMQLRKYGVNDEPKLYKPTGKKGGRGDTAS